MERLSTQTIEMWSNYIKMEHDVENTLVWNPESGKETDSRQMYQHSCCGRIFKSQKAMAYHKSAVHENFRISCEICLKSFTAKHKLRVHPCKGKPGVETTKSKTHPCHRCSSKFSKKVDLKHHLLRVHVETIQTIKEVELFKDDHVKFAMKHL